ncbi:MAG: glycosyl transferase group 1 [Benjaminiella poitrasii]|nr:MAG: glycosyl transferase group 1 [Benjaminiella poitrasii]
MRIAIVTENFLPKVDGVTRTLAKLLEHLQATDHKVILFGPESGMETYADAKLYGTAGIPFLPYPELKLNIWRPTFTKRLIEFNPHVIHLVDPVFIGAALLAVLRVHRLNIPVVSSYHTNLSTYCTAFGWGIFADLMWMWNRYCHSRCRYTVCPSASTRDSLRRKGLKNLRIWPRGIDISLFSPQHRSETLRSEWIATGSLAETVADHTIEETDKTILLYVGRVSFEKNLGLVIDSYKDMDHSQCHLVIVGHGPAREELEALCQQSDLPVTFTGYLGGHDLAVAFASADIFAFPSYTETFGQVVLESMASGLPVVGLLAEGVRDLVQDQETGLLLDVTNMPKQEQEAGYRALLNRLIHDRELRYKMKRNAVERSKTYTWWNAMEDMVQVYRDVTATDDERRKEKANETAIVDVEQEIDLSEIVIESRLSLDDSGVEEDFSTIYNLVKDNGNNPPIVQQHGKLSSSLNEGDKKNKDQVTPLSKTIPIPNN